MLVASGLDLAGIMNRHRFALNAGTHRNKELEGDWNGGKSFAFEVVEELIPPDEPDLE